VAGACPREVLPKEGASALKKMPGAATRQHDFYIKKVEIEIVSTINIWKADVHIRLPKILS